MKIQISNKSPNGDSDMTTHISGPHPGREAPVSHQPLDREGRLTVTLVDEARLRFEITGDIEAVHLTHNGISVRPSSQAQDTGEGKGRIVMKKNDAAILVIEVTVGGNTTVGLVIGHLG